MLRALPKFHIPFSEALAGGIFAMLAGEALYHRGAFVLEGAIGCSFEYSRNQTSCLLSLASVSGVGIGTIGGRAETFDEW
jgi:hypothetical protein